MEQQVNDGNGKDNIFVFYYRISLFYRNGDEDIQADAGMGEGKERLSGRTYFLRILLWLLGSVCIGSDLSAKTLCIVVVAGLFFYSHSNCLACRLSMGVDVLAHGENGKVILSYTMVKDKNKLS